MVQSNYSINNDPSTQNNDFNIAANNNYNNPLSSGKKDRTSRSPLNIATVKRDDLFRSQDLTNSNSNLNNNNNRNLQL